MAAIAPRFSAARSSMLAWTGTSVGGVKAASLAEKLDQRQEADDAQRLVNAEVASREAQGSLQARQEIIKSFSFHLGADLQIPTDDRRKTHQAEVFLNGQSSSDPFDGLPLKAWAERMGERIMPTYELIKDEQRKSKALAKNMPAPGPSVPTVPHLLPFTRWAANSQQFRQTFIAEAPKDRKKARLSWYHPDDTMVPRDWFKGGLMADLAYYSPFKRAPATPATQAC